MAISNASNQIVKVNLIPGIIPSVLHLSQYDTGAGRPITFSVYDGSQAFAIPSDVSIAFEGTKPDGNGFSFTCSKSGSSVLLTNYTNQMTALSGKIMCQLVFTDTSGGRVGSLPVLMIVSPAGIDADTELSPSDIGYIVKQAELDKKINTPIIDPNGTSGQLLRTLGNGETEWVDQGLPTDEQTAEAVTAWLDDHPEATTTVQDGSLTEQKFTEPLKLKAIKDYVTPEMFGAKGDGVTNDRAAFQAAIDSGAGQILVPKGNYLINGNINLSPYSTFTGASKGDSILINACLKVNYHCTVSNLTLEYTNTSIPVGVLVSSEYMGDAKIRNNVAVLIQNIVVNPYAVRTSISNKTYNFTAFELESGSTGAAYYGYWGVTIKDIYTESYVTTALKIRLNYRANYMTPWITCCNFENWQINGCIYAIVADYWTDGTTLDESQMISPMGSMMFVGFITQHVVGLSKNYYYSKIAGSVKFSRSAIIDYVSGEGTTKAFRFNAVGFYKWTNIVLLDETCGLNNSASEVYIDNITNGHDRDVYDIFGRFRNVRLPRYLNALYPEGIPANSDLNDYTMPGTYYCASSSIGTIANTPITDSSISVTNTVITSGRLKQIVTSDLGDLTYVRTLNLLNNVWNPFVKMPTRQELSDMLPSGKLAFSASANATINIPNASSGLLIITTSTSAVAGMLMYYSTAGGVVTVTDISIKGFTYTVSSGMITLNANSGTPSWAVGYMQTRGNNVPTA